MNYNLRVANGIERDMEEISYEEHNNFLGKIKIALFILKHDKRNGKKRQTIRQKN